MNDSALILDYAIKKYLANIKEKNLLSNSISTWINEKEKAGYHIEDHNWTSEIHLLKNGASVSCIQSENDDTLTFWLPISPDENSPYHADAVIKVFNHYKTNMLASPFIS